MWGNVRNVSYSILIDGTPKGSMEASTGLIQRDPLSPFLFLINVDVLSHLIFWGVEGNILEPFKVGYEEVTLSQVSFCSRKEDSFLILNHMVGFFDTMSGLKIRRSSCYQRSSGGGQM